MLTIFVSGKESIKFLKGIVKLAPLETLNIIVDTSDVYNFYGIRIFPDLINVFSLLNNRLDEKNFGIKDDSSYIVNMLREIDTDFELDEHLIGDRFLLTHLYFNKSLKEDIPLSRIISDYSKKKGFKCKIIPVSDDPINIKVFAGEEVYEYHDYASFDDEITFREIIFENFEKSKGTSLAVETI